MHSTSNFMVVWMTKKHLKEHWFEGRGWVRWLKSWETRKLFIWENWTRNVCIKMHCSSVDLLIFFFVIPSWKTFLVPTFSFFVRDIWDLPNPESGGDRSAFSASGDVQQWATSLQPIWEDASVCGPRDGFLPGVSHMWALCVLLFNTWLWQRKSMCILPPRCSRWSRGGCLGTSHEAETIEDQRHHFATDDRRQRFNRDAPPTANNCSQTFICADTHSVLPEHVIHLVRRQCQSGLFLVVCS